MKNKQLNLRRLIKISLLYLSIAATAQAVAEDQSSDLQISEPFFAADENQDGKISYAEYLNLMKENILMEAELTYKLMDNDGNGAVKPSELQQFLATTNIKFIFTSNIILLNSTLKAAGNDGLLSLQEFISMRLMDNGKHTNYLWKFARLDKNHDRQLTIEEFFNLDNYILPPELQIVVGKPEPTLPSNLEEPQIPLVGADTGDLNEPDFPSESNHNLNIQLWD